MLIFLMFNSRRSIDTVFKLITSKRATDTFKWGQVTTRRTRSRLPFFHFKENPVIQTDVPCSFIS